ncbi:MAG TPA: SDR family oxidoreductase [Chthoniobacterales bacterium]|jgi:NAD(P)-dependent dehydrogenase (short-subunit alcohol dehydrogenase family)
MTGSILITGASRGIGLALSIAFAKAEWTVFAGARRPRTPLLWNASQEFPNLHPFPLNVTDDISVGEAAAALARETDSLDVLVNNAAVFPGEGNERLEDLDLEWFAEAIETNVTGVARVTRAFLPWLRRGIHPRIINISSGAGSIADKEDFNYYPYSVSKAALNMLTRAMAAEFRPSGIAVTALSPGWVKTEMGGPNAPLTAEQSARSLYTTIGRLTLADSGRFLGRDGQSSDYTW